jgi:ABC-type multidrug transport system fused ATPase/permease subunit
MHFELRNVTVSYRENAPILGNVSFAIPSGRRVALIGQSGAGKTTIAGLVRRDVDPESGEILLDGIDLRQYRLSSVLRYMGVILQRPEIMSGTVRENITYGVPVNMEVTDDMLWQIIDAVSPTMRERFVERGLDTKVGKQGLQLSGGEQQRLCVMRALIKNPQFLIVDEATSSLDSETEIVVQKGIDAALARGISALVIAHRFSTLRNCDQFVVLKKLANCEPGEPQVECVAHSLTELSDQSPTFRRLAAAQDFRV